MSNIQIRPVVPGDRDWIRSLMGKQWGSVKVVTRGKILNVTECLGFVAQTEFEKVGLITYRFDNRECEIVTLNSLTQGQGIGTQLIEKVKREAKAAGCTRVRLITTNDNMRALYFYQKRGFVLKAVYPDALVESRKLKPEIPEMGMNGIPLRDEIELEIRL